MKANAPEKIWVNPTIDLPKLSGVMDKNSVEYIRKDTFVDEACEFLETYPHMFMGVLRSDMIEDFKKYMEE